MTSLLAFCLSLFSVALGHGMDKPGPHQGYIRMPGAFHTELVPDGENRLKVYLLDVEFKYPVTAKSSLVGTLKRQGTEAKLECKPTQDFFLCDLPAGFKLQAGDQVALKADRQGMTGGLAVYRFPLKYATF